MSEEQRVLEETAASHSSDSASGADSRSATAFLFPGQGSQSAGMGKALAESCPEAAAVFAEADAALGFSISQLCFEGSGQDLKPTEVAQPALLTCSVAALRCIEARGFRPDAAAGHSLGEYSAMVAAEVIGFREALLLVAKRGKLMSEAGERQPGTMAAVLGLDSNRVEAICRHVTDQGDGVVVPANLNAPGQVVISGAVGAVRAAGEQAKAAGAARVIPLAVSGAFHSPLMSDAARSLQAELAKASLKAAAIPIVCNATARPTREPADLRAALIAQMASGVRWEESMRTFEEMGITRFVEVGPGRVLSGLVQKTIPGAITYNVGEPDGLERLGAFFA
ncbi:MAG TPA: ACP S-malonyltransferase [Armatimonadota bacterium]|nr:ACP S-malonyltransferase [Armatimonadota bacterium]